MFHPINVSPYATNVLDLVGRQDLITSDGRPVTITRGRTFCITIGTQHYETDDNLQASYVLNHNEVGC